MPQDGTAIRFPPAGLFPGLPFPATRCQHPRMADKTLFEKIRDREIPADIIHEDEHCLAFRDIAPQAPVHILIVPRKPIPRVAMAENPDQAVLGRMLLAAGEIARSEGIAETGFRLVINNGPDGGEAVPHLHIHLIGGRRLDWPPG
jgi:histidine triad (HIT) family protein